METEDLATYDELTRKIIGCCFEVHNILGPGFLEKIYVNALKIKLQKKEYSLKQKRVYRQI